MIGKLDHEVIEKFKEFQEKTGKHSELYIEDVEFEEFALKEIHQKYRGLGWKTGPYWALLIYWVILLTAPFLQ